MIALIVVGLAAAFALATLIAGWWTLIVVALAAGGLLHAHRRIAEACALAALLGWAALLAWTASRGPLLPFAGRLALAMGVPAFVPPALTLLFPMLLGWSGGAVGQAVGALLRRRPPPR